MAPLTLLHWLSVAREKNNQTWPALVTNISQTESNKTKSETCVIDSNPVCYISEELIELSLFPNPYYEHCSSGLKFVTRRVRSFHFMFYTSLCSRLSALWEIRQDFVGSCGGLAHCWNTRGLDISFFCFNLVRLVVFLSCVSVQI